MRNACEATIALVAGDPAAAFELLSGTIGQVLTGEGASSQAARLGFPCALEAALTLGRAEEATDLLSLLGAIPPGHVPPYLRAQLARGRGLLAAGADPAIARAHLEAAIAALESLHYPYWLAVARTDLAVLLLRDDRSEEARAMLNDALDAFRHLGAASALRRAESVLAGEPTSTATPTAASRSAPPTR
jgi:hypothetical protein